MSRRFTTHRPSGKPSWPLILLAGAEKTGKSWEAARFSGSDLIGRTFWFQLGETTAEEYGNVPGADYEIVDYDGSYQELCAAAEQYVAEPVTDGKPNMIVIDSATILWDMLSAEQQELALRRRKPGVNGEAKITMDQWNAAKDRWGRFLNILRRNNGPVVLITRMDVVTLVDESGQPTKMKDWKIKAEKNLPYDVGLVVSMPARGEAYLSGLQSTRLLLEDGEKRRLDGFSLDRLMREMGLAEDGATVPRQYTATRPDADEAMADAGPQRPAQRGSGRSENEWTTPEAPVAMATPAQIGDILDGLTAVRGITEPAAKGAAVSAMLGREISNVSQITAADVKTIQAALSAEAESNAAHPAPAPADSKKTMTPRQKRMHALFTQHGIKDSAGRRAFAARVAGHEVATTSDLTDVEVGQVITALETGEVPPAAIPDGSVCGALAERIAAAQTSDALADVSEEIWKARDADQITEAEHSRLIDLSMARESSLSALIAKAREAVTA